MTVPCKTDTRSNSYKECVVRLMVNAKYCRSLNFGYIYSILRDVVLVQGTTRSAHVVGTMLLGLLYHNPMLLCSQIHDYVGSL